MLLYRSDCGLAVATVRGRIRTHGWVPHVPGCKRRFNREHPSSPAISNTPSLTEFGYSNTLPADARWKRVLSYISAVHAARQDARRHPKVGCAHGGAVRRHDVRRHGISCAKWQPLVQE